MKHPLTVEKYAGSLEELAEDVRNLRYDKFTLFLEYLSKGLEQDAFADSYREKSQLANALTHAAVNLSEAQKNISLAWKICEPYMKSED